MINNSSDAANALFEILDSIKNQALKTKIKKTASNRYTMILSAKRFLDSSEPHVVNETFDKLAKLIEENHEN